jgi:hypothetical protein
MRKAAFLAGLIADEASDMLLLSLEPECAAISAHVEASKHGLFQDGAMFLVADCGGGTVDITCYKVATADPLVMDSICPPTGGMWGGLFVYCQFEKWMKRCFGAAMYDRLERNHPLEVEDVKEQFRAIKQRFDPNTANNKKQKLHHLSMAPLMRHDVRSQHGLSDLATLVHDYNHYFPDDIPFDVVSNRQIKTRIEIDNTLVFTTEQMMQFFQPTVHQILTCVENILLQSSENIQSIVLVGGYGSSAVLGNAVRTKFGQEPYNKEVLIPDTAVKPQAAIVHGAAHYGLCTTVVRSRIVQYTYGVSTSQTWVEGSGFAKHQARWDDILNEWRVDNVFSLIVQQGEEARPGMPFSRGPYGVLYDDQTLVAFQIYRSTKYHPRLVTEEGCELLGTVTLECRNRQDKYTASFMFAAELRVEVIRCDGMREFKTIETADRSI